MSIHYIEKIGIQRDKDNYYIQINIKDRFFLNVTEKIEWQLSKEKYTFFQAYALQTELSEILMLMNELWLNMHYENIKQFFIDLHIDLIKITLDNLIIQIINKRLINKMIKL